MYQNEIIVQLEWKDILKMIGFKLGLCGKENLVFDFPQLKDKLTFTKMFSRNPEHSDGECI